MSPELARLAQAVQANCHVSDARHARELSLCTYLLEMRELYRWEQGIAPGVPLARSDVGGWLARREALWASVDQDDYAPLPIASQAIDPFDADAANRALVPRGYVYGAGLGRLGKPQFFLAALARDDRRDGVRVLVAGDEYARDLAPGPAALRGDTVYLRRDALRRWVGGKLEAWLQRRPDGAMQRALAAYEVGDEPLAAIDRIAAAESETLVLHELGEHAAGRRLGRGWAAAMVAVTGTRAEWLLRAARDNLADCLITLPALAAREHPASLHFWFANFDGLRAELDPALDDAYARWCDGEHAAIAEAAAAGSVRWQEACMRAIALHERSPGDFASAVDALFALPGERAKVR